eukprot:CAMPEP_0173438838 /NCGR_PEP_ID=MMETSP1357-20121228/20630_1 /TAXON_ID=77926 /ORGANISM="Hemiselmis rufescens, Strain PCC563" /LENGTH=145 /DNA_ID=CAMNT_0014404159 /DNA_START=12 /DNA_END=449 /DNA_ORIENTATION=-
MEYMRARFSVLLGLVVGVCEFPKPTDAAGGAESSWVTSTLMPTLISVFIIVGVSLSAQYSSLAAAIATAPTGTPLSIYVVMQQQQPHQKNAALRLYTLNIIKGVLATLTFAISAHLAARYDVGMIRVLLTGYAGWFVAWLLLSRV